MTSLPVLFENVVVETLLALKEIVIVKLADDEEGVAGEVHSRDNKELRDNTVGHFQGLWEVRQFLAQNLHVHACSSSMHSGFAVQTKKHCLALASKYEFAIESLASI